MAMSKWARRQTGFLLVAAFLLLAHFNPFWPKVVTSLTCQFRTTCFLLTRKSVSCCTLVTTRAKQPVLLHPFSPSSSLASVSIVSSDFFFSCSTVRASRNLGQRMEQSTRGYDGDRMIQPRVRPALVLHQLTDEVRVGDLPVVGQDVSLSQDHFRPIVEFNRKR